MKRMLTMCDSYVTFMHIFFIILVMAKECVGVQMSIPATDFKSHKIVEPILHYGRTSRELSTTRNVDGGHHTSVTLTVPVDGEKMILELELSEDLVPGDHTLQYQEGGWTVNYKPKKEELDLCHYHGSVRGKSNSWAAVSTCHGVSGVIFDGNRTRYIEPAEGGEIRSQHFLYDLQNLNTTHHCDHQEVTDTQADPYMLARQGRQVKTSAAYQGRYRRGIYSQIHEPYNANSESRYVELVLVADHTVFQNKGGDLNKVHSEMITMANILNSVYYAPLNIFIALVGVVVWSEQDQIQMISQNSKYVLDSFVKYRRREVSKHITNDIALLITGQKFLDSQVIGKAYVGMMCDLDYSCGVINYHSAVVGQIVSTMAHEMGHTLGMQHDGSHCKCAGTDCIMSTYNNGRRHVSWSSCSLHDLEQFFNKGLGSCLHNKPETLFQSPTCGNGFIEPGEQCDCGIVPQGGAAGTNACHVCCDPKTCMLRGNATCAAGACCDLTMCRTKSAGTVCRRAEQECDLPEYCSGDSGFCPDDFYQMDTTPCGRDRKRLMCMNRQCVLRSRAMWHMRNTYHCSGNCSGHGVCNSAGNCHCDEGLAPPHCAVPGPGGSLDSGPATDWSPAKKVDVKEKAGEESKTWIYVVLAVVILLCVILIMFLIYYYWQNIIHWWQSKKVIEALTCNCCLIPTSYITKTFKDDNIGENMQPTIPVSKEPIRTIETERKDERISVTNEINFQNAELSNFHREQSAKVTDYFQYAISNTKNIKNDPINENMNMLGKPSDVNPTEISSYSDSCILTELKMSKPLRTKTDIQVIKNEQTNHINPLQLRKITKENIQIVKHETGHSVNPWQKPLKNITYLDNQTGKEEEVVHVKPLRKALKIKSKNPRIGDTSSHMNVKANDVKTNLSLNPNVDQKSNINLPIKASMNVKSLTGLKPCVPSSKPNIDATTNLTLKPKLNVNTHIAVSHNFLKPPSTDIPNLNVKSQSSSKPNVKPNVVLKHKNVNPVVGRPNANVKPSTSTHANEKPILFTDVKLKPVKRKSDV